MSAPVLENGPYTFNVNNLFSETNEVNASKRILLELKNALYNLGGAGTIWTVTYSSDGVTAGAGDKWTDISDVVYANPGTNHSWCVLRNGTTLGELLIDYRTTNYYQVYITYSHGGFNADGTVDTAPTATDLSQINWYSHNFSTSSSNYTKFVVNVMTSADHKTTRWYIHRRDSSSGAYGGNIGLIESVVNTPSEWISTIKTCVCYYPTSVTFSLATRDMAPTMEYVESATMRCFIETSEPYAGWLSSYPTAECYNHFNGDAAQGLFENNVSQDFIGGYPVAPIGLFRTSNPYGGSLGRLSDIYWAQPSHSTLDTYPADVSRTWVKWGCLLVPWNGTQPQDAI